MTRPLVVALAFALPATAGMASSVEAGPLGEVNRDIGNKQDRSRSNKSDRSNAPSRPDRGNDRGRTNDRRSDYYYYGGTGLILAPAGYGVVRTRQRRRPNIVTAPLSVELFASYQNVEDSDGAINIDGRIIHGNAALAFTSSSFFESARLEKGDAVEQSRLTRWDASIEGRALAIGAHTDLWLGLGIGQLRGTGFDSATGISVSGRLRRSLVNRLRVGLGIEAGARGMMYGDDIKAGEVHAGVTASILHVGYRYLRFNVGPALAGPEVGVSLRF